jgi:hypothetical protein
MLSFTNAISRLNSRLRSLNLAHIAMMNAGHVTIVPGDRDGVPARFSDPAAVGSAALPTNAGALPKASGFGGRHCPPHVAWRQLSLRVALDPNGYIHCLATSVSPHAWVTHSEIEHELDMTNNEIDRACPHQVEIRIPVGAALGTPLTDMHAFCRERELSYQTSSDSRKVGDFVRFCFADRTHANVFEVKFGGKRVRIKPPQG